MSFRHVGLSFSLSEGWVKGCDLWIPSETQPSTSTTLSMTHTTQSGRGTPAWQGDIRLRSSTLSVVARIEKKAASSDNMYMQELQLGRGRMGGKVFGVVCTSMSSCMAVALAAKAACMEAICAACRALCSASLASRSPACDMGGGPSWKAVGEGLLLQPSPSKSIFLLQRSSASP